MPFEYRTKFCPVFRPPFEYRTGIQMVVWIPNYHLNTRHLNTGQVKVRYSDVSVIQIPTIFSIQFSIQHSEFEPHSIKKTLIYRKLPKYVSASQLLRLSWRNTYESRLTSRLGQLGLFGQTGVGWLRRTSGCRKCWPSEHLFLSPPTCPVQFSVTKIK